MSTLDFFRILLKLFGLYILVSVFSVLPQLVSMFPYEDGWTEYISMLFIPITLLSIFCLLVFYPDLIINKLRLDRGLDGDHIPFEKLDADIILRLGAIIAGGLLFLQNISPFLSAAYYLLKASVPGALERNFMGFNPYDYKIKFVTNILNLVIGYLLITHSDHVSRLLFAKTNPQIKLR